MSRPGFQPDTISLAPILLGALLAILPARPALTADTSDHWAFQPPIRPEIPSVQNTGWVRNPIDAFILHELETFDLSPAPEADRATLLRRLSFDLTGLPPTPDQVVAFLQDESLDSYETMVDRLLASPHYGERQAQHWLDLARYADTDGFEFDHARPNMWRYRDWVVEAFNANLPYDRFLSLQMAGDEIAPDDPSAMVATGFHRCYPDMVDMNDQKERRQIALNDITETTGLVFLGLTIGCARCHDHKFDPIPQRDFYRLQAVFTPAAFENDAVLATPEQRAEHDRAVRIWKAERAEVQSAIIRLEGPARQRLAPGDPPGLTKAERAAFSKAEVDRSPDEVALVFDALARDDRIADEDLTDAIGPEADAERSALLARLDAIEGAEPLPLPRARVLAEHQPEAPPTFLLRRGQYGQNGPEVFPGYPTVLTASTAAEPEPSPTDHSTGRRSALAAWLTRPDNPLTARVMVNRIWQRHFGRGIVATPSDFGTVGEPPSHPALLDWLATEFIRSGWDMKAMHRLIVTSASYRQSTATNPEALALDPDNLLVSHQNRRRLDGEAIRDALLSASGLLNPALGGPCVFPELPPELTRLSSHGAIWPVSDRPEDRHRRSLYVFVRRNLRYPFFEAFDRPDTNASCPQRPTTTIAPQALTLLNGRLPHQASTAMADRLSRLAGPDPDARIRLAFLLALGREPDATERRLALDYVNTDREPDAWASFCLALLNLNEFVYLD